MSADVDIDRCMLPNDVARELLMQKRLCRNEYQKVLMRKRRLLEGKELIVAEFLAGHKLVGDERTKVIGRARVRWNEEKVRFLLVRGPMDYDTKLAFIDAFWEIKHTQLNALVEATERRRRGQS